MEKKKNPAYQKTYEHFTNTLNALEIEIKNECKKHGVSSFIDLPDTKNKSYPKAIERVLQEINVYSQKHPYWDRYKSGLNLHIERIVEGTSSHNE
jgi:hypothetical protein